MGDPARPGAKAAPPPRTRSEGVRPAAASSARRLGEADALTHLGVVHAENNRHERALEYLRRASDLARLEGAIETRTLALNAMGAPLRALGRHDEALGAHSSALAGARECDDRIGTGRAHEGMAETLSVMGKTDAVREHRQRHRPSLANSSPASD